MDPMDLMMFSTNLIIQNQRLENLHYFEKNR